MKTLNIIGAGKLGRTLGRLWQDRGVFQVGAVCNRSLKSALAAVRFIGAGKAASSIGEMPAADCWLIASGDAQIGSLAEELSVHLETLSASPIDAPRPLVFHCSGALDSQVLASCRSATLASAHPVHSFAEPARSLETLAGTSVAIEGEAAAQAELSAAFNALDCRTLTIASEHKTLYHAGSVFACNYLTALMDLSLQCFAVAGIDEKEARALLQPIVLQTARNNMELGPAASLTGPIARGDAGTVAKQLEALAQTSPLLAANYRHLGLACVELARRGNLPKDAAEELNALLNGSAQ
ncbi:DUF2520 domain-containing protein [Microbulbifer flavimaris]|uniref:DUF2520 domain-containing protein n=1 Tax=Microbulbifer flavimaris TaxID=1781068 RepID=A0ABX4I393_9GAMM|nr:MULTISPECIES: Rossmann-like and DUF2520 domain-containing protein [Microbulbifer]KUJ84297.1 hypothetical protein AVO43_00895 [Microbulbifer sp. ZGT114]PCO06377.1 DUF2520 domain-containing protein [Microbulbifer flavimaris]